MTDFSDAMRVSALRCEVCGKMKPVREIQNNPFSVETAGITVTRGRCNQCKEEAND